MKILATVALLHLCLSATATVSGNDSAETALTAAPGDIALLPCYSLGNATPSATTWTKDGREVTISGGGDDGDVGGDGDVSSPSAPPAAQRLAVLRDGRLRIAGVMRGDEGSYLCNAALPGNVTFRARVLLQVTSGPEDVSVSVGPASVLPNGTLVVHRGSSVSLNCSGSSYPSQRLTWAFSGAASANDSLVSASGPWLRYRMEDVQPGAQGVYSCRARNTVSRQAANKSAQLLVYYAPDRHPDCMWAPPQDPSHVQLQCTWPGAYPAPTLRWAAQREQRVYAEAVADAASVTLNRSLLHDGQTLRCTARHEALAPGKEMACSLTLKAPYPEGDPMATALEATSVTLTCTETAAAPAANTTWRKGLQQDAIEPGSKYLLSDRGPVFELTILNVSKDDEGVYFCRSENPLGVRELEVYLTVRASSTYTGAIIGVFIAALIVGSAFVIAKTVYSSRHRICLGGGFGQMEEDGGDVLSLVESDDEQIFQDAVPRLPPLANGHHTTLVLIHRIPSSDHEDAEAGDASPQQQEDTAQTEEPGDLVTF